MSLVFRKIDNKAGSEVKSLKITSGTGAGLKNLAEDQGRKKSNVRRYMVCKETRYGCKERQE